MGLKEIKKVEKQSWGKKKNHQSWKKNVGKKNVGKKSGGKKKVGVKKSGGKKVLKKWG